MTRFTIDIDLTDAQIEAFKELTIMEHKSQEQAAKIALLGWMQGTIDGMWPPGEKYYKRLKRMIDLWGEEESKQDAKEMLITP